jgi:hypothetical protein
MQDTFKMFLASQAGATNVSAYRPKAVSVSRFIEWCESNASQYLEGKGKHGLIYRGFMRTDIPPIGIIDTSKFNRVSANTFNYYTLWIDNHSDWKSYPKRSKSLVCTQSYSVAEGYAAPDVGVVIPADSSKIGVCPENDIWRSVKLDKRGMTLYDLNGIIYDTLSNSYGRKVARECESDYKQLVNKLKRVTVENVKDDSVSSTMKRKSYTNLYDFMENTLSPEANGFNVVKAAHYVEKSKGKNEVWVQGECMVLKADYSESMNDSDYGELSKFLSKYDIKL